MSARDALLVDVDHEMAVTRRVMARVPDAAVSWQPHERSFSLGSLAMHLAQIPRWGLRIMDSASYDAGTGVNQTPPEAPAAEILSVFDQHAAAFRQRLVSAVDGEFDVVWTLRREGHLVFSLPRMSAIRIFVLHHLIHHRGQLTVYLRLQDVAIPPIYGSTADEAL